MSDVARCEGSDISGKCTGEPEFELPDGRKVCKNCVHCCTSGQSDIDALRISAPGKPAMPRDLGDIHGQPTGFRFD